MPRFQESVATIDEYCLSRSGVEDGLCRNGKPLLASNPEAIVFALEDGESAVRAWWTRWPQLAAVKNGAIYAVNGNLLTRSTPRMLDGVEELCRALSDARAKYSSK